MVKGDRIGDSGGDIVGDNAPLLCHCLPVFFKTAEYLFNDLFLDLDGLMLPLQNSSSGFLNIVFLFYLEMLFLNFLFFNLSMRD